MNIQEFGRVPVVAAAFDLAQIYDRFLKKQSGLHAVQMAARLDVMRSVKLQAYHIMDTIHLLQWQGAAKHLCCQNALFRLSSACIGSLLLKLLQ